MARPLKYDQQFTLILEEKLHDRFLNIFNLKVQSTAFCQKLNLQRSLVLASVYDIIVGMIFVVHTYKLLYKGATNYLQLFKDSMYALGLIFGILGFDCGIHLKKQNSLVYKHWRIFITFIIPILEVIYAKEFPCPIGSDCNNRLTYFYVILYFVFNLYLCKIVWSFNLRLKHGHELLIIHGKYLEEMLRNDNVRLEKINYQPPKFNEENDRKREQELINMSAAHNSTEEDMFTPKAKENTFLKLIDKN